MFAVSAPPGPPGDTSTSAGPGCSAQGWAGGSGVTAPGRGSGIMAGGWMVGILGRLRPGGGVLRWVCESCPGWGLWWGDQC